MTINLSGLGIDYGAILPELIVVGRRSWSSFWTWRYPPTAAAGSPA